MPRPDDIKRPPDSAFPIRQAAAAGAPSALAELDSVARRLRFRLVQMSHAAKAPHLGSGLSCIDLLTALYWRVLRIDPSRPDDPLRDRCILSKGHAAAALYATLALKGFFPAEWLDRFARHGGPLAEQPSPGCAPGVELATGSLGHGLSVGAGVALAGKIRRQPYRVFVVMSDGECNEGSVWEAAMFAPAHQLDNLAVMVDYNKWQATGRSQEVMALDPLTGKWEAFGWGVVELDGHDPNAIVGALESFPREDRKPLAVVAHTVKGKGISFMEDDNNWHYRIPNAEEVEAARRELLQNPDER